MKTIALIAESAAIEHLLKHLELWWEPEARREGRARGHAILRGARAPSPVMGLSC